MKITTLDLINRHPTLNHSEKDNCGVVVFNRLPIWVRENLTCWCDVDYREARGKGTRYVNGRCTICNKPRPFSVAYDTRTCDGCGNYYLRRPDWKPQDDKYRLCSKCDVEPIAKPKRSGFSVS